MRLRLHLGAPLVCPGCTLVAPWLGTPQVHPRASGVPQARPKRILGAAVRPAVGLWYACGVPSGAVLRRAVDSSSPASLNGLDGVPLVCRLRRCGVPSGQDVWHGPVRHRPHGAAREGSKQLHPVPHNGFPLWYATTPSLSYTPPTFVSSFHLLRSLLQSIPGQPTHRQHGRCTQCIVEKHTGNVLYHTSLHW